MLLLMATGTVKAQLFDWREPSARAAAMGGAFTAVSNDMWAGYYNPAGLSRVENYGAAAAYNNLYSISFLKTTFGVAALPINGKWGTIAISVDNFGVNYKDTDLSSETVLTFSHGLYIFKDFNSSLSVGYNVKILHWSLGESQLAGDLGSDTQLGFDIGFQASLYDRTWIGLYVTNINRPEFGENYGHELQQKVVAGIAYMPYSGVTTTFDIKKDIGRDETQYWGGVEFELNKMFYLRSGAMVNPNRFSFGGGMNFHNLMFDYAILTHPNLSETHQFGISYTW